MKGIQWRSGWGAIAVGLAICGGAEAAPPATSRLVPAASLCRVDGYVPAARVAVALQTPPDARRRAVGLGLAATMTREGRAQLEGKLGELQFRKSVDQVGRVVVDLEAAADQVHFEIDERGISVSRDRESVRLVPGASGEAAFEAARRMLGGSHAVGLLRAAAAGVMEADDDAPDSVAVLMADAVIGMLTGDVGAPGRVARHLPRRARAQAKRAAVVTSNCYSTWEQNTLIASYEWEDCALSFSIWDPVRHVCAFRWVLQVESYWFTFLTCSGLSGLG